MKNYLMRRLLEIKRGDKKGNQEENKEQPGSWLK